MVPYVLHPRCVIRVGPHYSLIVFKSTVTHFDVAISKTRNERLRRARIRSYGCDRTLWVGFDVLKKVGTSLPEEKKGVLTRPS
jgi:hypothetical protein